MAEREPGPEQLQQLAAQLAAARDEFRRDVASHSAEKAKLDRREKQIGRLHTAARAEKLRIRNLYRRFLKHMKRKWAAERTGLEAERRNVARERAEADRTAAAAEAYQDRLRNSWEHLNESQRRFLVERQQAEHWLAVQTDTLDHRAQTLSQQEKQFAASIEELESKRQMLKDEIAGLDSRAANARITIEKLELKQSRLLVPADGYAEPFATGLVPLNGGSGSHVGTDAEGLLDDLHSRRQDMDRVRRKIFSARDELERQTTTLDDQRAILTEQVAALVAARELWNSAELATMAEMESLAKALRGKERGMDLREQQLIEAEKLSRDREGELWNLREQLEAWRKTLAALETANLAARDQRWAALGTSQKQQAERENALAGIIGTWSDIREKEREQYTAVLEYLEAETEANANTIAKCEVDRREYAVELARLASLHLALEEQSAGVGPAAQRKMRILTAHWEKHFKRWQKRIETGKAELERTAAETRRLREGLQTGMNRWLDERTPAIDLRLHRDRLRFASEMAESTAIQLPEPANDELVSLNTESDRFSEMLGTKMATPEPAMNEG